MSSASPDKPIDVRNKKMAPTNIIVAGSTPGQGFEEWVGTLLWWGGLFAGMAALCITLVWATQEERVALPSGGYRRVPRHGPHSPLMRKLRRLTERVGAWLVKITEPPTERSQEEQRRSARAPGGRDSPGREGPQRMGQPNRNPGVPIYTDRGRLFPTVTSLDSGATLSVYMDDILLTELAQPCRSRNCPAPTPGTPGLPGRIVDDEAGSTPPSKERPGSNSRTRTTNTWVEVVRGRP
ncbi:hypothetical protein DFH08DRAFT_823631 [Mycena albidolilacea]|uniref:Uncharacterized protein n=1 Tax=Mycena albidolilacea TaxID=1033008 RepID=A0AAD6Z6C9_9AGAR|nr:hypothetical protein DFH08DRAFT_823631 [Mycena albidolilacea]